MVIAQDIWTWDINNFVSLSRSKEGGTVTFRDDTKRHIIGYGNVKIGTEIHIERGE